MSLRAVACTHSGVAPPEWSGWEAQPHRDYTDRHPSQVRKGLVASGEQKGRRCRRSALARLGVVQVLPVAALARGLEAAGAVDMLVQLQAKDCLHVFVSLRKKIIINNCLSPTATR
jgi:hypothetical protein